MSANGFSGATALRMTPAEQAAFGGVNRAPRLHVETSHAILTELSFDSIMILPEPSTGALLVFQALAWRAWISPRSERR